LDSVLIWIVHLYITDQRTYDVVYNRHCASHRWIHLYFNWR